MAFNIPKLEYKNVSTTGNTSSGSPTISSVDVTDLEVGMFVKGAGIPAGATILTVGASSIDISANASATSSGATLSFGFVIEFDYPPKEPKGEAKNTNANISESLSGIRQVSTNYIEGVRSLAFSFLSQTQKESLDTFLESWGLLGFSFRYFEDKTSISYVEYELETLKTEAKIIAPKGANAYVWELPLKFRRII